MQRHTHTDSLVWNRASGAGYECFLHFAHTLAAVGFADISNNCQCKCFIAPLTGFLLIGIMIQTDNFHPTISSLIFLAPAPIDLGIDLDLSYIVNELWEC